MMIDKLWYPALNVAAHHAADFPSGSPPKKVEEMMSVAMTIAGLQEIHQRKYWIQGVSDSEGSPDVRTAFAQQREGEKSPWLYQQDVEVVTYTPYSTALSLAEFVAEKKMGLTNAYDELTTILVNVQAKAKLPTAKEWSQTLKATGKNNPVLILGLISTEEPMYRLAFVHPEVEGAIDYNAIELLKKHGSGGVMKWSRGSKHQITRDDEEKHCPFEAFGVKCNLIK